MGNTLDLEKSSLVLYTIDLHHDLMLERRHPDLWLELNLDREGLLRFQSDVLAFRGADCQC